MDPKVNGQLQHEWSWLIATYLFMGGIGGGAYVIGALNAFAGKSMELTTYVGLGIGFPALCLGGLALIFDLGKPFKAYLAGMKPGTSWLARGFWVISSFMLLSLVHWALLFGTSFGKDPANQNIMWTLGIVGSVLAISTMAYTGILLGASKGIPFWRSGVVPALFVVSAVVTGHFAVMLGVLLVQAYQSGVPMVAELRTGALEAAVLVVIEVLAIFFFIQAAYKTPDSRESAERILNNRAFTIGYIIAGLLVPLVLMLMVYLGMKNSSAKVIAGTIAIGAAMGLLGGLLLRWGVLISGAMPTWNIAGFKFRRTARPKAPMPKSDMLPPGNM